MLWHCRQHTLEFAEGAPPLLMGVVNVTPDSFSDGGKFLDPAAAVAHAFQLVADGADILDIGGESTRPNATPVSEAEELRRVLPVIERLAVQVRVPLSIDTQKPAVVRAALAAGASIVNDIAANRADDALWRLVAETGAGYVAMHMQGTPADMQTAPRYTDVVREVGDFFTERLGRFARAGVRPEQVALDVGIGFGKTVEHNLQLLGALGGFRKLQRPLLLGVSRKSFIARIAGETGGRLPGSLACALWAAAQGVAVLRVHDVAETRQALLVSAAIRSTITANTE
jgi:dihydropteroate synthase